MLYGLATLYGALAMVVRDTVPDLSIAAIVGFTTALVLLGVHLGSVKVYGDEDEEPARDRPLVAFLVDVSYKRRVFQVLLDVVLIGLSYYAAVALGSGRSATGRRCRSSWVSCPSWSPSRSRRCWRRGSTAASGGT